MRISIKDIANQRTYDQHGKLTSVVMTHKPTGIHSGPCADLDEADQALRVKLRAYYEASRGL